VYDIAGLYCARDRGFSAWQQPTLRSFNTPQTDNRCEIVHSQQHTNEFADTEDAPSSVSSRVLVGQAYIEHRLVHASWCTRRTAHTTHL